MLRVSITLARHDPEIYADIKQIIGHRTYIQGTDPRLYVDFSRREDAHLALVNLNQVIGVMARIENDHAN
jgi:hypothetical protein